MRPCGLYFGEPLDKATVKAAVDGTKLCKVFIIAGTSSPRGAVSSNSSHYMYSVEAGVSHWIASQPLLSGVNVEQVKTNLGRKRAHCRMPISNLLCTLRESSTQIATSYADVFPF